MGPNPNQRARIYLPEIEPESGLINEQILVLVLESLGWDLRTLCSLCAVSRKLRAVAKRILWRQLSLQRAPKMVTTLTLSSSTTTSSSSPSSSHRILGGWVALTKLLFYCCGCQPTRNFKPDRPLPGHFCNATRFSKTSGRSFLSRRCRGDLLYVSDPCEHALPDDDDGGEDDLLGIYRGVFGGFLRSKTRACLVGRQIGLEESMKCPYCRARVWSMTSAGMVPKSAWRRLGARQGGAFSLEYFVCVNGHLYGACWLVPLSSEEDGFGGEEEDDDDDDDYDDEDGGGEEEAGG